MLTRPWAALPRYSGATASVATSQTRLGSSARPLRSQSSSALTPQTGSMSFRLLKPAGEGSSTRMAPAGTARRWSTTQMKKLLAS